ncbi:MAG: abortive infection family protein, partial [Bryobacteraceae bacterium]
MSDLTNLEKRKFERLFEMGGGYVLNFSNRTFDEFVTDTVGRSIYDSKYDGYGSSKANRLRAFWQAESNHVVGKLMGALIDYQNEVEDENQKSGNFYLKKKAEELQQSASLRAECRRIVTRLLQDQPVPELEALAAISDEKDFEVVARAVRDAIEKNEPESALDRLHTFVIKYVRTLCTERGLLVTRDKPLHSLFGEYVKSIEKSGKIESGMTLRILKSTISTLDAFNDVRNNRSLAHDNPILNYDEALLI